MIEDRIWMSAPLQLTALLADYVAQHHASMLPYAWKVRDAAWKTLGTGFDHNQFSGDLPRQNVELKRHLAAHWSAASIDEKIRIAAWIVKDWGGIRQNSEMTILSYVNQADAERPATPFNGIASYSKILAIKNPDKYAIFDARVAASLNAIQFSLSRDGKLQRGDGQAFSAPPGENRTVTRFNGAFAAVQEKMGLTLIGRNAVYSTYMILLHAMAEQIELSVLEIEMFLFAQADDLCQKALPVTLSLANEQLGASG